ncbi:MAG TPA: hypothetical protein VGF18_08095, partial [Candidatus Tumulicola sp.]
VAYDQNGDLFVYGSTGTLVELPRNAGQFEQITLPLRVETPGGIAWDGKYLAIADADNATVYRFTIKGSTAKQVDSFPVDGANIIKQITIDHNRVLVPSDVTHGAGVVSVYHYPAGGERVRTLRNFSQPYAAVVSRGPKS